MRGEDIPALELFLYLGQQKEYVERIMQHFRDARWTHDGPQHSGVFYAKSMNAAVEGVILYEQDHSLRACTYARPYKDSEICLLPSAHTCICSDPPYFMIGSEGSRGGFREGQWTKAMAKAGLPAAFITRITPRVRAAIERYGT